MDYLDRLFRNLIVILIILCAGCVLSLAYYEKSLSEPHWFTVEGNNHVTTQRH